MKRAEPPILSGLCQEGSRPESRRAKDRRRAIHDLQGTLERSLEQRNSLAQARTSVRLADLHRALGSAGASLPYYRLALESSAEDPWIRAEALVGMSRALLRLEDLAAGEHNAERALELSRSLGDGKLELAALVAVGDAQYSRGALAESLGTFERAVELARIENDPKAYAEAALYLGFAHTDRGDDGKAILEFENALQAGEGIEDGDVEARALVAMAHTYSKIGEKQRALELYHRAAPLLEELGDPYKLASFHTGMGYLYDELGDAATAEDFYGRALRLNQEVGFLRGIAGNFIHLGRIQASAEKPGKARRSFEAALGHVRALGLERLESVVLGELANVQTTLGDEAGARENYARALALSRSTGDQRIEAEIQDKLGSMDLRSGNVPEARRRFQLAIELGRKTESRFHEARALFHLACAELASGRYDAALARSAEALDLVESLRSRVASHRLRAAYVASVYEMHVFHVDLLMELDARRPGAGFDRRAFLAAERARARSLLEMLQDSGPESGLSVDLALLRHETLLEERLRKEASSPNPPPLRNLVAEIDRVRSLRIGSSEGASFAVPAFVGVAELQRSLLDDRTLVLAYFLGERASYLWVISSSSFESHRLPSRRRLEEDLRTLHGLLATRSRDAGASARKQDLELERIDRAFRELSSSMVEILLGPAAAELGSASRLIVVGDGMLHQIPFSALPLPGRFRQPSHQPLVSRFEIVRLPSVSTLKLLEERRIARTAPRKKLAVLADPVFDELDPRLPAQARATRVSAASFPPVEPVERIRAVLRTDFSNDGPMPRLLSTRLEARRILELVPPGERFEALGFDASRSLVASGELSQYEVVHFATHGILDVDLPELSGIVLSLFDERGRKQDGFLRLQDVYDLDLPVRLVVLSACSTGLGKPVRGEGLIGLVGGFLSTGAQGVMASYWDVDDEATAELMKRFYQHLFAAGRPAPKALQLAQMSMWKEERWTSPRYWAAFELQGDWQ